MSLEPKIEYQIFRPPPQNQKIVEKDTQLIDYLEYKFQAIHENLTDLFSTTNDPSEFEPRYEIMREKLFKLSEPTFKER